MSFTSWSRDRGKRPQLGHGLPYDSQQDAGDRPGMVYYCPADALQAAAQRSAAICPPAVVGNSLCPRRLRLRAYATGGRRKLDVAGSEWGLIIGEVLNKRAKRILQWKGRNRLRR